MRRSSRRSRCARCLTLRQTQGLLHDLTRLLGLGIEVPRYSTFSRRAATLPLPKLARPARTEHGGPLHLAIDATGLKVHGEGDWEVRVHGKDKRRVWRKLHLAVDPRTGTLDAHVLTPSETHDGAELEGLLADIDAPIARSAPPRPATPSMPMPPSSRAARGR